MHWPTCVLWANLTPFSLKLFEARRWGPRVDPRSPFTLERLAPAFSLSATGSVVGKIAIVP